MRRIALIAVLGVAFALYLYSQSVYSNRFRLTLEVQTPHGIKSGSSVIETSAWESGAWGPAEARGIRRSLKGRAVWVDLGDGKNLMALLAFGPEGHEQHKLFRMVSAALAPSTSKDWKDEYYFKGTGALPRGYTPTLITFADPADAKTARVVDPDNLEAVFGQGYAFLSTRLETTSEPISGGIEKILPWWNSPGRPAEQAYRAWLRGSTVGESLEPELLFQRT